MSRPFKPIDWEYVDVLLEAGCLGTEIASHFDMHPDTFYRRIEENFGVGFTDYCKQKKYKGDSLIRKVQFDKALSGDNTLLIWLGKNRLGQKENQDPVIPKDTDLTLTIDLLNKIEELNQKIKILEESNK